MAYQDPGAGASQSHVSLLVVFLGLHVEADARLGGLPQRAHRSALPEPPQIWIRRCVAPGGTGTTKYVLVLFVARIAPSGTAGTSVVGAVLVPPRAAGDGLVETWSVTPAYVLPP